MAQDKIPLYLKAKIEVSDDFKSLSDVERKVAIQLREQGYAILRGIIEETLIDQIIDDCKGKYTGKKKHKNEGQRIQDAFKFSRSVRDLATDNRICNLLSQVYGRTSFPFQTLNFERGTEQRTHSDTIHFSSIPNLFMTGVWVAFEKNNKDNGPLHYIKKSANLPVFDYNSANISSSKPKQDPYLFYSEYEAYIEEMLINLGLEKKYVEMNKGDVFVWTANLLHGGNRIIDLSRTRLSQVTHYFYEGCSYYTPLLSNPLVGKVAFRRPIDIIKNRRISFIEFFQNAKKSGFTNFQILRNLIYTKTGY